MKRQYLIGSGLRSDDIRIEGGAAPGTHSTAFPFLSELYARGDIDHIQVLIIPESGATFRKRLEMLTSAGVPIIIHAPHHGQGVNPCAPDACPASGRAGSREMIEEAMAQTFEAADTLRSPSIVIHAGTCDPAEKEEGMETFHEFLDTFSDPRLILENLPSIYGSDYFLGTTADEVLILAAGRMSGYCLDFAHLYCTTNHLYLSYQEELAKFDSLDVRLHHLSNTRQGSVTDSHLTLDHPDGGLDMDLVFGRIRNHPQIHTSLELKDVNPETLIEQLRVFDRLFRQGTPRSHH